MLPSLQWSADIRQARTVAREGSGRHAAAGINIAGHVELCSRTAIPDPNIADRTRAADRRCVASEVNIAVIPIDPQRIALRGGPLKIVVVPAKRKIAVSGHAQVPSKRAGPCGRLKPAVQTK